MHTVRTAGQGNVDSAIDDDSALRTSRKTHCRSCQSKQLSIREVLFAQLDEIDTEGQGAPDPIEERVDRLSGQLVAIGYVVKDRPPSE
jgi:hypothetical protein